MKHGLYKKGMVFAIIGLVVGASFVSSVSGDIPEGNCIKDIQNIDLDELVDFLIEASKEYPWIQNEIILKIEEIGNNPELLEAINEELNDEDVILRELEILAVSNNSSLVRIWWAIFLYRLVRFGLSYYVLPIGYNWIKSPFLKKFALYRTANWGIKLFRWIKIGIILGIVDVSPPPSPENAGVTATETADNRIKVTLASGGQNYNETTGYTDFSIYVNSEDVANLPSSWKVGEHITVGKSDDGYEVDGDSLNSSDYDVVVEILDSICFDGIISIE